MVATEILRPREVSGLTGMESEVLNQLKVCATSRQIAVKLYLSPRTIDVHRSHIRKKDPEAMLQARREFVNSAVEKLDVASVVELTPKERALLEEVAKDSKKTSNELANRFHNSRRTIEYYKVHIYEVLGMSESVQSGDRIHDEVAAALYSKAKGLGIV